MEISKTAKSLYNQLEQGGANFLAYIEPITSEQLKQWAANTKNYVNDGDIKGFGCVDRDDYIKFLDDVQLHSDQISAHIKTLPVEEF